MIRTLALVSAVALLAAPALADPAAPATAAAPAAAPAADPGVYQVLRPTDKDMSCEALAAESNSLNAKLLKDQQDAQKHAGASRFGRSVAGGTAAGGMKVAGRFGLSRMAGSFGPMGTMMAMAASDAVADSAGQAIANGGQQTGAPQVTPEQQRMNHLISLYKEKGC